MTTAQETCEPTRPLTDLSTLRIFINECRVVLDQLVIVVQARLRAAVSIELKETDEARRIQNAYQIWLERYKQMEGEGREGNGEAEARRQQTFAEQVSYVFFVRLLLARVLEDKGIMPRLVSDGGFKRWFEFLQTSYLDSLAEIRGEAFLPRSEERRGGKEC